MVREVVHGIMTINVGEFVFPLTTRCRTEKDGGV